MCRPGLLPARSASQLINGEVAVEIAKMPSADARSSCSAKAARSLTALVLLSVLAAGCATTAAPDMSVAHFDYKARHPIMISEEPEVLDIPVGMNGPAV